MPEAERLHRDAHAIYNAALKSADAYAAVQCRLRLQEHAVWVDGEPIDLGESGRIVVVGAGKASARMAQAVEAVLGDRVAGGVVSVKDGHSAPTRRVVVKEAAHPLPDRRSLANGRAILDAVSHLRPNDVVLCLLSGGGSALMESLPEGLMLDDLRAVTRTLMLGGADIVELNCVRKHLSEMKGGQLARAAAPARVVSLILSDVIGDDLSSIASGPTVPDPTTFGEALEIMRRYGALDAAETGAAVSVIRRAADGALAETPKPDDPLFARVRNVIVGSNRLAVEAAAAAAKALGYDTRILSTYLQGEAREVGRVLGGIAREQRERAGPAARLCYLGGGETTVTVRGEGRGGRNQECALGAVALLEGLSGVVLLCAATDGGDGSSDAAGAVVDGQTQERARAAGLHARAALDKNDSHTFFAALGTQVKPGPTMTNVNDLVVMLVEGDGA